MPQSVDFAVGDALHGIVPHRQPTAQEYATNWYDCHPAELRAKLIQCSRVPYGQPDQGCLIAATADPNAGAPRPSYVYTDDNRGMGPLAMSGAATSSPESTYALRCHLYGSGPPPPSYGWN